MKILDKIKKGLIGILAFVLTIPTKVFSAIAEEPFIRPVLYGPPKEPPKPSLIEIIWNIARNFIFPIVLLIGIIIYLKKSKSSKKRKIITVFVTISIVVILCLIVNYIINNVI